MYNPENDGSRRTTGRAIVIGAGVIGVACALELQRRGFTVTLIDGQSKPRAASWGNAGHIAVEQAEPLASQATILSFPRRLFWRGGALALPLRDIACWLPFAARLIRAATPARFEAGRKALGVMLATAMPAWRRYVADLGEPDLLRENGHFVVWESEETATAGRATWAKADTGTARLRAMTDAELASVRALVTTSIYDGVRFSGSGQIADLPALASTALASFVARGGQCRVATVTTLPVEGGVAAVGLADGTALDADTIVVATGAMSRALLAPLGLPVPMIAERGYHIQAAADPRWPETMPPVVFEDRSLIVTRFRSGLRATSFVEFGRVGSPPDPRKWRRLHRHVAALGVPFAEPDTPWMGARPTLPDYLPAIGHVPGVGNLLYAFGHNHLGLTLSATTAEAVGALATGDRPAFDLAPFSLDRFA